MSGTSIELLRSWLMTRYDSYVPSEEPIYGTYGIVFILQRKRENIFPEFFAVKTLNPEKLQGFASREDLSNLRREFQLWLELPFHLNVVSALGFDILDAPESFGPDGGGLPVMRMKKMDGSLSEWIGNPSYNMTDRLIALAQAANGLIHMYREGFQGHGDLKPSNILFSEFLNAADLKDDNVWPNYKHPWLVSISDLGWADAWRDLGYTTKALREYLAPERLENQFVPEKSDVFSLGVIASELLQGKHPARNLKRARKSEGEWGRWVRAAKWDLDGVHSPRMNDLIRDCLHVDPDERPDMSEFFEVVCAELKHEHELPIEPTLRLWGEPDPPVEQTENLADSLVRSSQLGDMQAERAEAELVSHLARITINDYESCERWTILGQALKDILRHRDRPWRNHAQLQPVYSALLFLNNIDELTLKNLPALTNLSKNWQPYERFAVTVERAVRIAELDYDDELHEEQRSRLFMSAFAYSLASELYSHQADWLTIEKYLGEAIRLAPDQAVPYYFRAYWVYVRGIVFASVNDISVEEKHEAVRRCLDDAGIAHKLAPEWVEPTGLVSNLKRELN